MNTKTICYCVVALFLGMLLANMLKNVCGCNVVEGLNRYRWTCRARDRKASPSRKNECANITPEPRSNDFNGVTADRIKCEKAPAGCEYINELHNLNITT